MAEHNTSETDDRARTQPHAHIEPSRADTGHASGGGHISLLGAGPVLLGSALSNTVVIKDPTVAPQQAEIALQRDGRVEIRDVANGATFVNGRPVQRDTLLPGAEIRVGKQRFILSGTELVPLQDANEMRVDAIHLEQRVQRGSLIGSRKILLDDVSLTLLPGSFVAIVGASGSGKTTLLRALSGQATPTSGEVLYNGRNLLAYRRELSSELGYVPQDDIVHKNLSVERALFYAGRLRLPNGTTHAQIEERVGQVLGDVELTEQRHQLVAELSGGQRKRVNIALELLARPAVFYLDEPTSGLDPGLDLKMMKLLRRLADRGQTVVLVTHATNNIDLCDGVCFLAPNGRVAYYGPPEGLKQLFGSSNYADIYNALYEAPDEWVARFRQSADYVRYVESPRMQSEDMARDGTTALAPDEAVSFRSIGAVHQFFVLTRRYLDLFAHDPINLMILLAQAPIIALLVNVLAERDSLHDVLAPANPAVHTDFFAQRTLFILACSAIWFGIINAAREIVKEKAIYLRERTVNLGLMPYVLSKVVVLGALCAVQSLVLLAIVGAKSGYPPRGILWPGTNGAFAELYFSLVLMALVGLTLGLLVSALAPTTDRALSIVPIILIPQIMFSNVIFSLSDPVSKWISYLMPSRWGMQAMGSIVRISDRYAELDIPFYRADAHHLLGFWGALAGLALLFFALTLIFQKAKDLR